MIIKPITEQDQDDFNQVVHHPLQSYEWGVFREKTGIKVIRRGIYKKNALIDGFQLTIHPIPRTPWTIGYLPKGNIPTAEILDELCRIGHQQRCVFIQLEPNIQKATDNWQLISSNLFPSAHPLFTKYTFILDLTKSEDELLKAMHPKTRYNIKVAHKHEVEVVEDNSPEAFERYWRLMEETTKRQWFYAHTKRYHQLQWQLFSHQTNQFNHLSSHLFTAHYQGKILTTMLFFVFGDTLYYPYGASSSDHRNVMHSTLTMWEAIRFGQKLGLKRLDMWGALGTDPDPKDPWFGFHDFKKKYGPEHIAFVGSYDLIIKPSLYKVYTVADKLRWMYLKMKK